MKKISLFIIFSNLLAFLVSAQGLNTQRAGISDTWQRLPDLNRSPAVEGDFYEDKHWSPLTIYLYSSKELIEGYYGRYDIYLNEFEIMTQQGVKVLSFNKVKAYAMNDSIDGTHHSYVNTKEFGAAATGFFEIFSNGPYQLGKRVYITIRKPDYDPVLRTGSKEIQILKGNELYLLTEKEAFKVKNKKQFIAQFGDKSKEIESFMKLNGLTMSEKDLRQVIDHYNEMANKSKQ